MPPTLRVKSKSARKFFSFSFLFATVKVQPDIRLGKNLTRYIR
jgi:hypothetical protein